MVATPPLISAFLHRDTISTRWMDNDAYGHVNNVVYYSWFDTIVNAFLIRAQVLDVTAGAVIGLVVESQCNYFRPVSFPQPIEAGLRVAHLGTSSVRYDIGIFDGVNASACASGHFVHVYVERDTRRPTPLPVEMRAALQPFLMKI